MTENSSKSKFWFHEKFFPKTVAKITPASIQNLMENSGQFKSSDLNLVFMKKSFINRYKNYIASQIAKDKIILNCIKKQRSAQIYNTFFYLFFSGKFKLEIGKSLVYLNTRIVLLTSEVWRRRCLDFDWYRRKVKRLKIPQDRKCPIWGDKKMTFFQELWNQ